MERPDAEKMAKAIRSMAHNAYRHTLVSDAPRAVVAAHKRMTNPRPGDLVCEISTISCESRDLEAVGYLQSVTQEPVGFDDPNFTWDEKLEGCPRPTEEVFNILTLDGRASRWTNAQFIAALTERINLASAFAY